MRWNPFRREDVLSRDEQLAEQAAAGERAYAAGRYEVARAEFDAAVTEYWEELLERPDDMALTELLATGLSGLARSLDKLGLTDQVSAVRDEAVGTSRRAVELRRAAGNGAPDIALARTLRTFAQARVGAGVELDEAATALDEAMALNMAVLTRTPSREHLAETYATELVQAQLLARRGKHVEAARVADLARAGHLDGLLDALRGQQGP